MPPGPFLVFGWITIALPSQPPCGRERPAAAPSGHLIEARGAEWRLRALPSARREVVSTTATKTVESPVTPRRNHAERVQGSIGHLSDPWDAVLSQILIGPPLSRRLRPGRGSRRARRPSC